MRAPSFCCSLLATAALSLLCACHPGQSPPALRADKAPASSAPASHGEAVFRLQNAVLDELIAAQMRAPTQDDARDLALAAFEDYLVDDCASLNQAAGLSASGADPGLLLKLRVLVSLSGCEQSAQAARTFLRADRTLVSTATPIATPLADTITGASVLARGDVDKHP